MTIATLSAFIFNFLNDTEYISFCFLETKTGIKQRWDNTWPQKKKKALEGIVIWWIYSPNV